MSQPTGGGRSGFRLSALGAALVMAAAAALVCTPLSAQDALVLSGGGSRGLAHAGAIQGFEKRGFRPDIIVGASMGAIMGALYSAGYTPDSIARLMRTEDFTTLFSAPAWVAGPARVAFQPVVVLRVGGGDAASATGLVSDQRVNRALLRLLFDAGARARSDFDALPRRFRAVATDLASGDEVTLGRGDLARAVRASMAVPGVFAPLVIDEQILVDGGIANYLPVVVARRMGARRIVAVDVLRPAPAIESTAPLAVALRGYRELLLHTLDDEPPPDLLVLPRIPQSLSAAYFPRNIERMLALGEAAAVAAFRPEAVRADDARFTAPPARLDSLVVEGANPAVTALVRTAFRDVVPAAYDAAAVLRAVDRVYTSGIVSGVWARVEQTDGGRASLHVRADAAAATRVSLAPGYHNDRGGELHAALSHRPRGGRTELIVATQLGALDLGASIEARHRPAALPAFSLGIGAGASETDVRQFDGSRIAAVREVERAGGWLGVDWRSIAPDLHAAFAARAEHVHEDGGANGLAVGPLLRVAMLPRAGRVVGSPVTLEAELRTGDVKYRRVHSAGSIDGAAGHAQFAFAAAADVTRGDPPQDVLPALGGDNGVPGLRHGRGRASVRVVGGPDVAYPLFPMNGFARLRVRAGFTGSDLEQAWDGGRWTTGAELAALWPTPLGTALLGVGATLRGDWRFNVSIGTR